MWLMKYVHHKTCYKITVELILPNRAAFGYRPINSFSTSDLQPTQ